MEHIVNVELRLAVAVLAGLALFGCAYNRWVERLEREGSDRGYMGFIVAFGCAVTIAGYALITGSLALALVLLACFVASGTPMIVGSVGRHLQARKAREARHEREAERALGQST